MFPLSISFLKKYCFCLVTKMRPLWPIGLELNVKAAHVINPRGRFQVQGLWAQRTPARETSATYKQSSLGVIWVCYREVRAPQRQINLHSAIWLFKRVMNLSLHLPDRGHMSGTQGHSKPTVSWTCKWVEGGYRIWSQWHRWLRKRSQHEDGAEFHLSWVAFLRFSRKHIDGSVSQSWLTETNCSHLTSF